ncbi:hypothetical protein EPB74_11790 [Psychrobacter sp. DAB_AL62B]|nr:hypothetical protein [Psychrobacter sp. DAB_AL62B]
MSLHYRISGCRMMQQYVNGASSFWS